MSMSSRKGNSVTHDDERPRRDPVEPAEARRATRRYHLKTALMVLGLWAVILTGSWILSPRSFDAFFWGTLLPLLVVSAVAIAALLLWRAHVHGHGADFRRAVAKRFARRRANRLVARSHRRAAGRTHTQ